MPVVIDSNLYIDFLRTNAFHEKIGAIYTFRRHEIHFSSVVAEELYQGVLTKQGCRLVDQLVSPFAKVGRIVTPTHRDWVETGRVLSKLRQKRKDLHSKLLSLINDALIAMSIRHVGGIIYTSNQRDFEAIASIRKFDFEVVS